jgi:hypothetical protein
VPIPKNGGSHAELESVICIFPASPNADAHIHSRSNLNRDDGGHDTPRYAGRRCRMVLQKERKHELCVPDPSAMSGVRQRKRRHLRPTQASLVRRSTRGVHFIVKAPRLPDTGSKATTQLSYSRLRRRSEIRKNPKQGDRRFIAFSCVTPSRAEAGFPIYGKGDFRFFKQVIT